jgi:uncharacterized BrkB/YihY/UPF0761 family membrane protein
MTARSRLPKRLVWVALLFIAAGVGTISSELEDFFGELAPVLTDGAASGLLGGSIASLLISIGLGVLYVWTGYSLLRRWECWRRRAVYLSKFFIGLLVAFGIVLGLGSLSGSASLWIGEQQTQDPSSSLWTLGVIPTLSGLGVMVGLFIWALQVLQDDAMRREFFDESEKL